MRTLLKQLFCTGFLLVGLASAFPSVAWAWPDRPIKLVVPYPPGAMGDTLSRLLADELKTRLGQPVLIDNKAGAGGNIGAAFVSQSQADGHTFLIAATNNLVINQYLYPMTFDPLKAFEPVMVMVDVPAVVFVNAETPATSFKAFVDYAKSRPGKVNYASPGAGTTIHLFSELLNNRNAMGMAHIPYKGSAPALTGLLGNEVQMYVVGAGVGAPQVKAGKLRALAVAGNKRSPIFPDTPTFSEVGISGDGASNWWAVAAPAGMPKSDIQKFHKALQESFAQPKIAARLSELGVVLVASTPEDMGKQLEREAKFWAKVVKDSGVKVE
jgi:tripartite-type tricarboxylate transporter receptor subunit TctC